MPSMTITEALSELHVIEKRIEAKRRFVAQYLLRDSRMVDPFEKQGSTAALEISREMQAIMDLEANTVAIRQAIRVQNDITDITIEGISKVVGDWLVWRREVATGLQKFLSALSTAIDQHRKELTKRGQEESVGLVVSIDEHWLAGRMEQVETILERLDGQLSLKNATTLVTW